MIQLANRGMYTTADAANLLGESPGTIHRWAFGYRRRDRNYPPAINTQVPPASDGSRILTFLELIELLFIQGFLRTGVSWARVRDAACTAARLLQDEPHPFAMKRWFVDPAGIYLRLGREFGEDILVEVAGDAQVAMDNALQPYLQQIEFDMDDLARRWFPMGRHAGVVIDPHYAYGQPVVMDRGVPTDVIADRFKAGDSVEDIAAWFEMDEYEVEAAINFESRHARA